MNTLPMHNSALKSILDTVAQRITLKNCYEDLAVQKEDICFDDDYSVLDLESSHKLKRLGKFDATKPFTDCELKSCIQQLKQGSRRMSWVYVLHI